MFREIPRFPPLRRFRLILTFLELVSLNKSSTSDEWDCNSCNISSTPTGGDILLAIGRELDDFNISRIRRYPVSRHIAKGSIWYWGAWC